MISVLPSIVETLMNKIALCITVRADDWTAERAIITSNGDAQFNMKSMTSRSDKFVDNLCSDPLKIVFKYKK